MAGVITNIPLQDDDASNALGRSIAGHLHAGDCLLLEGPLGAGKTALARAIIQVLQVRSDVEEVPSPTYTLVQTYDGAACPIWHADLFRLSDPQEIHELGLLEAMDEAITLIEWPDRLGPYKPARHLHIALDVAPGDTRHACLTAVGSGWDWTQVVSS